MLKNFSFVATTSGQTIFGPIDVSLESVVVLGVAGALQDQSTDFTLGGIYITLTTGVPVGTKVSGVIDV